MEAMHNFSVLILTFNEEKDIADCIKSVSSSNDIVVLDSFSTDGTKEIVSSFDANFVERKFTNYSDQRNYGLHQISYKNDYVLILDADERATKELIQEISTISNSPDKELPDVYFVRRRVLFEKKILKWNYTSTVWLERFVKPKRVSFVGNVHEKVLYKGENGFLKQYIIHDQFSKGTQHWIERRKKYAMMEMNNQNGQKELDSNSNNLISHRLRLKKLIQKIPFFYLLYFVYNLFVKFAFLDGPRGLKYIAIETYSFFLTSKFKRDVEKPTVNQVPASIGQKA